MLYYLLVLLTFCTGNKHSKINNSYGAINWSTKEIFNWFLDYQEDFQSVYKQKKKTKVQLLSLYNHTGYEQNVYEKLTEKDSKLLQLSATEHT